MPERLKKLWPFIKENNLRYSQINDAMCPGSFPLMSYLWICNGLELFDSRGNVANYENVVPSPDTYKEIIESFIENAPDQKNFLSSL
jgi:hypothetical protein